MKNTLFILAFIVLFSSACSDESDRLACEKATKELAEASEAIRILKMHAPSNICNPCTAVQIYQNELGKLYQLEAAKKSAKAKACN